MITKENENLTISPKNAIWEAKFKREVVDGLKEISLGNDTLVKDVHCYLDDTKGSTFHSSHTQDYKKQGVDIIKTSGENNDKTIELSQTYRFHNNCVRITTDLNIRPGFVLNRRIGIGSLFLPGEWSRMTITPPINHLIQEDQKHTIKLGSLPNNSMVGHWHHPPLSLIFERKNGKRIEVGTGSDLWRWDSSLQEHPDTASYKVVKEESKDTDGNIVKGIRIIREPLMTCTPYTPEARQYRFSWYLSWDYGFKKAQIPQHNPIDLVLDAKTKYNRQTILEQTNSKVLNFVYIDLNKINWHQNFYTVNSPLDLIEGKITNKYCLEANKICTTVKELIRKLKALEGINGVVFRNLTPHHCYLSSHVNSKYKLGKAHWGINSLLELAAWIRHKSDDEFIAYQIHDEKDLPPSLSGLLNDYL